MKVSDLADYNFIVTKVNKPEENNTRFQRKLEEAANNVSTSKENKNLVDIKDTAIPELRKLFNIIQHTDENTRNRYRSLLGKLFDEINKYGSIKDVTVDKDEADKANAVYEQFENSYNVCKDCYNIIPKTVTECPVCKKYREQQQAYIAEAVRERF